jgi:molybdopterin-binding protein
MGAANPPPSNGRLARKWGRLFLLCGYDNTRRGDSEGFCFMRIRFSVQFACEYLTIDGRIGRFPLMEQSIRNEIPGTVKEIISDKVLSEIIVETRIGEMAAVITTRSVQDMGLKVGDRVAALVKATNVFLRRRSF